MRVLIYIPNISQEWGGIRQYSVTLLTMLCEDYENEYFIYHDLDDKEVLEAVEHIPKHYLVTSKEINVSEVIIRKEPYIKLRNIPVLRNLKYKRQYIISNDLSTFCAKNRIAVLHCLYQSIPLIQDVKLITTLHDVQEIHFPKFFSPEERAYRAAGYLDYLKRAHCVIVSYNHIKNDLINYFNVPPEKIKTVLLQMDKLWFHKFSEKDIKLLPGNLNKTKYLLYPANFWKHKNHLNLLRAIALLRDEEGILINFVFTGDFNSEDGKRVKNESNKLNLINQITFLGIVDESLLYSLYKNATGTVIPTLYEAGSFPLMESIYLSVPVICSNVTSLPETIGNSEFVFDPTDIRLMASLIKKIYLDKEFRNRSLENSKNQKEKLTQNQSLHLLKEIYRSLIEEKSVA
jgi:glycosyltransferase involved in cell wall biosynthesis